MITVVGSFNMDLFVETPRLPGPGETVLGKSFRCAPGGKGANQAYAVARMGLATAIIGAVGQDPFGDEMIANLRSAGVDTRGVLRRAGVPSGVGVVMLEEGGQNRIVVANGANDTLRPEDIRLQTETLRQSSALITQLETPAETVATALGLARDAGVMTVLNPAPFHPASASLLSLCDWAMPNEAEASQLAGEVVSDPATACRAAGLIRRKGRCRNVVITLGEKGAWVDAEEFTGHVPGFAVQAVDTVGAGDTFIGTFVARLVCGVGVLEAARWGCAAAAIAVTRYGAQASVPTAGEVEAMLARA